MAKDSSFDVVSEVNMQEVDNAFQQTTREISQRYDLKDSGHHRAFEGRQALYDQCPGRFRLQADH